MMGLREEFTYFQCGKCKCLQITEIPDDMTKYYSNGYYSHREKKSVNVIKRLIKRKRNEYAVFRQSLVGKLLYGKFPENTLGSLSHLKLNRNINILDVGCGTGELLRSLHQMEFKNLTGIDPFNKRRVIKIGGGTKIYKKSIYKLKGQWDVIMMHHVFEHMANPLKVLNKATDLLTDSGCCLIRIPVVMSTTWQKFRQNWVQLDPPRHYFIHSPESFQRLINKTGLKIKKVIYDSTAFQFWGSIQYEKDIPLRHVTSYAVNPKKSIFTKADIQSFKERADELNRGQKGDQAIFILQKKNSNGNSEQPMFAG